MCGRFTFEVCVGILSFLVLAKPSSTVFFEFLGSFRAFVSIPGNEMSGSVNFPNAANALAGSTTNSDKEPVLERREEAEPPKMSKSALKKLRRQQEWEAGREKRAGIRREKKKQKKEERKRKIDAGEKVPSQKKKIREGKITPSEMRVVLDCGFDELMNEKEIASLCQQFTRCHSANRTALHPVELYATDFGGRLEARQEYVLRGQQKNWKRYHPTTNSYLEEFVNEKEKMVYLSADSDETLHELKEDEIYIIGALVDKNRYKNICDEKAKSQGIRTAKLPIGEYIRMSDRKVLTVNHVFEILSLWLEHRDWEKAFLEVIPKRKGLASLDEEESREQSLEQESVSEKAEEAEDEAKTADGVEMPAEKRIKITE
ncbi:tRNA m(1)G methyltransferase Trm10 [Schizosaccharomyces cryophilus OY26]|uniref:tRNA (guanine(9)-N1)-methyltransferase n=1 Tax=Schizosaccharomyces cryophilus (strain OY26 / ATCC MYA-4695 / CBS 11777 / NBRC 106824 / NRRL Y48691) TaxID=653667 RepID=S9X493_SCHCR|nr:tRNA m(1)G methyltransferase Trm10 [Schizosaccharomyces cryophilus OY26]EPY51877.1 tRNA m(1)G methyltransferase Trm10 [Schizosaccharomyces cryophilus OY26]